LKNKQKHVQNITPQYPDTDIIENFRISGEIKGAANEKLFLEALTPQGTVLVAECSTDGDGEFDMLGNIPNMGIYQIRLGEQADQVITLPLVPMDNVTLIGTKTDFAVSPSFEGTEWSQKLTQYMSIFKVFAANQQQLLSLQGKISEDELMAKYIKLRNPLDNFCRKTILADPGNALNFLLSSTLAPNMGFKNWNPQNLRVLKTMSTSYSKKYADSPISKTMQLQVQQIEQSYQQFKTVNTGNQLAPEITLKNPEGAEMKLSSLRGQYVLLDFWASWCRPCRKENPNVVALYHKYKNKGFTVFSVSLDSNVEAWKAAIKADDLVWPHHVSDLKGWDSKMPSLYGFQGIPYTVLIDKEGKIIETNLRGNSLEQKLKELIKN
jgi:peroxiredoxin